MNSIRNTFLVLVAALAGLTGGCPTDTSSTRPVVNSAQAVVREMAEVGQSVLLVAVVDGAGDLSQLRYQWYQVSGRAVTLDRANEVIASFPAPSVESRTTLQFRVDIFAGSAITSAETSITIEADPNYGLNDNSNSDGSGGDDEPNPQVRLTTDKGVIVVQLDRVAAPVTVRNFLRYVDSGFYNDTIFHRVIPDFVVQGGGFETGLVEKDTQSPIVNESTNGLLNLRGTIAMARTNAPNSATSQFYFNLVDNDALDRTESFAGYAVFGRVIVGMSVVDEIATVETGVQGGFSDVPLEEVFLQKAERVSGVTAEP